MTRYHWHRESGFAANGTVGLYDHRARPARLVGRVTYDGPRGWIAEVNGNTVRLWGYHIARAWVEQTVAVPAQ